jgi:hypothetical protein
VKNIYAKNLIRAPQYPHSSHEIIRRLSAAIELTENPGEIVHEKKVAQLIGVPKSTYNEWGHHDQTEQIRRFLSGLERLSDESRMNLLRSLCRHCPRLEDPRISHDKQAVAALKSLIQRTPGISLITGSKSARNYLLGAIGNSFAARYPIKGFDSNPPLVHVPVPGVFYPSKKVSAEILSSLFEKAWVDINGTENSLILLNGIWDQIPTPRRDVLKLAAKNHIFVADDFPSVSTAIPRNSRFNVIRIDSIRGESGAPKFRIRVTIR